MRFIMVYDIYNANAGKKSCAKLIKKLCAEYYRTILCVVWEYGKKIIMEEEGVSGYIY